MTRLVEAIDVRLSEKDGNFRRSTTSREIRKRVLRNGRRRRKMK